MAKKRAKPPKRIPLTAVQSNKTQQLIQAKQAAEVQLSTYMQAILDGVAVEPGKKVEIKQGPKGLYLEVTDTPKE
jgi:hypothetical protein